MSKAGIQSNRGDGYQTLVAMDLALTVLSDPDHLWIEVDSLSNPVDDVVVGKANGHLICCQCKKNQPLHKSWSFSDLKDELQKAIDLLTLEPNAEVRFYSRDSFGDLKALKEFSANFPDAQSYQENLTKAHLATDSKLLALLQKQGAHLDTYHVLQCIKFEVSPELERMQELLRERLRSLVSQHDMAFDILWRRLDQLGMRVQGQGLTVSTQHRLTKTDLKELLFKAGSLFIPPVSKQRILSSFESTSSIGRSWCREIGKERLPTNAASSIIEAVKAKTRSVLLTGQPGAGKTCVMLTVLEELERHALERTDLQPLFIQAREFADLTTAHERQAQGLNELWVEEAARLADEIHVVVLIDSLDVLSIAREHKILSYFLAQIDRLLQIPNVTVVTACREFDSQYDRRIAQRPWEAVVSCEPLDWATQIAPLLDKLGIETSAIDSATQGLLCNPRELALFVDLAKQGGSFNVVTSQALATRYLSEVVEGNPLLGNSTLKALEQFAGAMLRSRSLSLPRQQLEASDQTRRTLLSNNILHERQDSQLEFGHQTLLDVLVISGALRHGVRLSDFIKQLPPVPFVRPTIRSFTAQLSGGDRREFRKQIRAVLAGDHAFHIRRLVAETYAEQTPHDDDWPMIRDLRNQHKEVFQAIYSRAGHIEWHHFWMRHLVPYLEATQDTNGLLQHAYQVSRWSSKDTPNVLAFWLDILSRNFKEQSQLAHSIAHEITRLPTNQAIQCSALIKKLLDLPIPDHSFVGCALAFGIEHGDLCDSQLWAYITGNIQVQDLNNFGWENKLRCRPHEFGGRDDGFLPKRLMSSTDLLNLAVSSIESWSAILQARYHAPDTSFERGFLRNTSYEDAHSEHDDRHVDNMRYLLDGVEAAIINHGKVNSDWWIANQERICHNPEGSLRYFGLLVCTTNPHSNLGLIGSTLSEPDLYDSALSYEVGTLIQASYIFLEESVQNSITSNILSICSEYADDLERRSWMVHKQSNIALSIPCHLRSDAVQAILKEQERNNWPLIRQAYIGSWGGMIRAPFSYQVFIDANDDAVIRLLSHYRGHHRHGSDEHLVGGEDEVGGQLRIASSYQPCRFLTLLSGRWESLSERFRDDVMEGCANHLAYRFGNLRPNDKNWTPIETPEGSNLAKSLLVELEHHSSFWQHRRSASSAIESCAYVSNDNAKQLISLATPFLSLQEESPFSGDSTDLLTTGINMKRGKAAEAMITLANQLEKSSSPWPKSLPEMLTRLASDKDPAIRSLLIYRLPFLQSRHPKLGWKLFQLAMAERDLGLWELAEPCLYYAYYRQYELVAPYLSRLRIEGQGKDLETWGRLSALCAMAGHIQFTKLISELNELNSADAWCGAANVWTHSDNIRAHFKQCFDGLEAGLSTKGNIGKAVANKFQDVFRGGVLTHSIPSQTLESFFEALRDDEEQKVQEIWGFNEWLNAESQRDPMSALRAAELYLAHIRSKSDYLYDHDNHLTQFLTRLFAEAEEQEESDEGQMLLRIVALQDTLLTLGVRDMENWLKAAERP